jgi:hypothetical protein
MEQYHTIPNDPSLLRRNNQQDFSLTTNQPPATSQQYFSLTTNQHQLSATSQTNKLILEFAGETRGQTERAAAFPRPSAQRSTRVGQSSLPLGIPREGRGMRRQQPPASQRRCPRRDQRGEIPVHTVAVAYIWPQRIRAEAWTAPARRMLGPCPPVGPAGG